MSAEIQRLLRDAEQLVASGQREEAIDVLIDGSHRFPTVGPILAALIPLAAAALRWDIADDAVRRAVRLTESRPAGVILPAIMPFTALTVDLDPRYQRWLAEQFVTRSLPRTKSRRPPPGGSPGVVRIGYLSADIRNHPVMHLGVGLFECHDRDRFHVTCFSTGPPDDSVYRRRVIAASDQFIDLHGVDNATAAAALRAADLDVAIDLSGHTQYSRIGLLADRPARVQLSYLGYPGSTGASFIDGFVADASVAPDPAHFTETLLHLPRYYQINDRATGFSGPIPARRELGLDDDAVVLCSFASAYKIEPVIVERWARILRRTPATVLWVLDPGPEASRRLTDAIARSVDPRRIIFAPPLERSAHLSRLRAADLCLDTYLVGGHTTTSDAVRAGVPVLTSPRSPMIARVSASLLSELGMTEVICHNLDDYEERAVHLANSARYRHGVRQRLSRAVSRSVVFDPAHATKALEDIMMGALDRSGLNVAA